jgi:RimJ/RimL family protein N-acetyltransferase
VVPRPPIELRNTELDASTSASTRRRTASNRSVVTQGGEPRSSPASLATDLCAGRGQAFRFPPHLPGHESAVPVTPDNATVLSPYLENRCNDVSDGVPMTVVLHDGKAVSVCCSVRMTPRVDQAGVETHPDFRGRGYAARAVGAWAKAVYEMPRVPLYSTSWENEPSRTLAKKLGLIQYGVGLHIT